jgi:hypothetical protein
MPQPNHNRRLGSLDRVTASESSPSVVEVLRFEDLPLGSRGSRRAVVRWSDGSEGEALTWYADEVLVCEGDLVEDPRGAPHPALPQGPRLASDLAGSARRGSSGTGSCAESARSLTEAGSHSTPMPVPAYRPEQARAGPALGRAHLGESERRDATPCPRRLHGCRSDQFPASGDARLAAPLSRDLPSCSRGSRR